MLFTNLTTNISIITYFYLTIYNLTLLGLFWVIISFFNVRLKTLYSFNMFSFDSFFVFFITVSLFSLAGVPPFMGFFNKLYLLNLISQNKFFLLNFLLLLILMFGLYFYMQNLRFIHSTNLQSTTKPYLVNERTVINVYYYLLVLVFILINGFFLAENFFEYFTWLLF